jgi:hypothetical protein
VLSRSGGAREEEREQGEREKTVRHRSVAGPRYGSHAGTRGTDSGGGLAGGVNEADHYRSACGVGERRSATRRVPDGTRGASGGGREDREGKAGRIGSPGDMWNERAHGHLAARGAHGAALVRGAGSLGIARRIAGEVRIQVHRHAAGRRGAAAVADALTGAGEGKEDEEKGDHTEKIESCGLQPQTGCNSPSRFRTRGSGPTLFWRIPAAAYLRGTAPKSHRSQ